MPSKSKKFHKKAENFLLTYCGGQKKTSVTVMEKLLTEELWHFNKLHQKVKVEKTEKQDTTEDDCVPGCCAVYSGRISLLAGSVFKVSCRWRQQAPADLATQHATRQ